MVGATTIRDDTGARHKRKYENANPLQRLTLGRFHDAAAQEIMRLAPRSILDFGCGEGLLANELIKSGAALKGYLGVDLRAEAIAEAQALLPDLAFQHIDLFELDENACRYDLVMASQVLEHLFEPERYLAKLAALSKNHLFLTVPQEPWFQLLNLARGRDFIRLGNHPEHINHWNTNSFAEFVSPYATVERCWAVFPFVFLRASVK